MKKYNKRVNNLPNPKDLGIKSRYGQGPMNTKQMNIRTEPQVDTIQGENWNLFSTFISLNFSNEFIL